MGGAGWWWWRCGKFAAEGEGLEKVHSSLVLIQVEVLNLCRPRDRREAHVLRESQDLSGARPLEELGQGHQDA
jgi:hypothetical protein